MKKHINSIKRSSLFRNLEEGIEWKLRILTGHQILLDPECSNTPKFRCQNLTSKSEIVYTVSSELTVKLIKWSGWLRHLNDFPPLYIDFELTSAPFTTFIWFRKKICTSIFYSLASQPLCNAAHVMTIN